MKESFVVIGKEGSTTQGEGFIQKLWEDANAHFHEVESMAKKDADGTILGIWGAMSDFSRANLPWECDFTKGLYLAGVECLDTAEPPKGWVKWVIPSYEYLYVECKSGNPFSQVINYMKEKDLTLVGAVLDFTCPKTGKNYMFFPIRMIV